MKHKMRLYTICICLSWLTAFSQNNTPKKYTKKISDPFESSKTSAGLYNRKSGSGFTFSNGKEFLTCYIQNDIIAIRKNDLDKLTLLKENVFEKFFPNNFFLVDCIELNGKYFVFYSSWDGDAKKEQVFSVEIDFATCEFVGKPKLLLQVDGKVLGYNSGFLYFNLSESANKKGIAINYTKNPENKKSGKIIGVKEFDENLNQTFASEIELPYDEREVKCSDFRLANNGDFYWIAKVFHDNSRDDKKKKNDLIPNFNFEICSIKFGEKVINTIKVEDNGNVINALKLFVTPSNLMVCGGTYSNGSSDVMDTDGYVGFKINPNGTIYDTVFGEFSVEVLKQYKPESDQRDIDKKRTKGESSGIIKVSLQDVHVIDNGDMVFIGEQKVSTYLMSSNKTIPFYLDIIVSKIKPNGNVVWIKKIPKYEMYLSSYWHVISNNNCYFIFVDDIHNVNLPLNKRADMAFGGNDEFMSIMKISDSDGTVSNGEIFNNKDFKNYDIKKYMRNYYDPYKISENEIVFEINQTKNGSGDVMVKVNLD
jgi:hypothetical protein